MYCWGSSNLNLHCPIVRQLGCPIYLSSVSLQNSLGKSKTHSWWGILVPLHFSDLLGSEWQWELRRAISPFYGTSKSLFIVIYRYVRRYVVSKLIAHTRKIVTSSGYEQIRVPNQNFEFFQITWKNMLKMYKFFSF